MNFLIGILVIIYQYWVWSFVLENVWVWHMAALIGITISQAQFVGIGIFGRCLKQFCWGNLHYADASALIKDNDNSTNPTTAIWMMYLVSIIMPWAMLFWGWALYKVLY
jgi:hypothetical protein